jgi:hypothetical protein
MQVRTSLAKYPYGTVAGLLHTMTQAFRWFMILCIETINVRPKIINDHPHRLPDGLGVMEAGLPSTLTPQ